MLVSLLSKYQKHKKKEMKRIYLPGHYLKDKNTPSAGRVENQSVAMRNANGARNFAGDGQHCLS